MSSSPRCRGTTRDASTSSSRTSSRSTAPPGELDREAFLEAAAGPYEIDEWAYEEIDPEVYGDTAVLVSRYSQTARLAGRDLSHTDARNRHLGAP